MISVRFAASIATITLDRPPVNAINEEWLDRLETALDQIKANPEISVLVIRSNGKAFCAGADLALMAQRFDTAPGRDLMIVMVRRIQHLFARIENLAAVSIAEINGAAMGGGLELALACDLRVIAQTARVGLPEAALGLLPGAGGTQRLTQKCGDTVARRLILAAEVIDGATALDLGLANWCVPLAEIARFTDALALRVSKPSGQAQELCKRCIDAAGDSSLDGFALELAGTEKLLASPQTQARVRAFLNKG